MRAKYSVFFVNCSYLRRLKSISPNRYPAPPMRSMTNSTYRTSTAMLRQIVSSNATSLIVERHVRSKFSPTSSPLPLMIGEPELPPVVWLVARKQTGTVLRPSMVVAQRP